MATDSPVRDLTSALLLGLAVLVPGAPAAAQDTTAALDSPEAVTRAALEANRELAALEAQVEALRHAARQAGVWMDPIASVEYSSVPVGDPTLDAHPMAGLQFRLQQTLPWPGKTDAREDVAEARVDVARLSLAERRNQLAGLVQDFYWRLALTRHLRDLTASHVELVEGLLDSVTTSYEVGRAAQHDLLRLQVLRDRLADDLADFDRGEQELLARLNGTLHRPLGQPIGTPDTLPLEAPAASEDELLERAARERPLLRRFAAQAQAEALAAARADAERSPDVTLWAGYRYRVPAGTDLGEDFLTAGVSIPLPWFWNERRWGELAQQHRANRRALDAEQEAAFDALRGELGGALAAWRRAYEKAQRYETELGPLAERTLDATLAAYRVGRADFASLYQAELQLLDFERAHRTARVEAARAAVQIRTLAGLQAIEGAESGPTEP